MKIPFQIYDFLSILFPAILFMFLLKNEVNFINWDLNDNYGGLAVLLVFAYIIGDALSRISSYIEKTNNKVFGWIIPMQVNSIRDADNEVILNGRLYPIVFQKNVGEEIIKSVNDFYNIKVDPSDKNLFELIYAPVHDRMGKRETFLSIANMMRSFSVISFSYAIYTLLKAIYLMIFTQMFSYNYILIFVMTLTFYFIFIKGYKKNKNLSEYIPYTAFLSWYKQRLLEK